MRRRRNIGTGDIRQDDIIIRGTNKVFDAAVIDLILESEDDIYKPEDEKIEVNNKEAECSIKFSQIPIWENSDKDIQINRLIPSFCYNEDNSILAVQGLSEDFHIQIEGKEQDNGKCASTNIMIISESIDSKEKEI